MIGFKPYKDVPDESEIRRKFHGRINIFFFSAFLIFASLSFAWPFYSSWRDRSWQARKPGSRSISAAADPGSIIDASGTKLAYSTASNSLYITLMKDYSKKTDKGKKTGRKRRRWRSGLSRRLTSMGIRTWNR